METMIKIISCDMKIDVRKKRFEFYPRCDTVLQEIKRWN